MFSISLIICMILVVQCSTINYIKYRNNWAFFNYGQTINTVKGCKGIDIGMNALSKSKKEHKNRINIAVVDSGVYNKPDACYYSNMQKGWDFFNEDGSVYDAYAFDYHGTYVANEIYAICPDVSLIPVKFMSGTRGNSKDCVKSVKYAIDKGARIINCSWCFDGKSDALEQLIRNNPDILFVVAAGNMSTDLDKVKMCPCGIDCGNLITVGAMDSKGLPTDISGYGKETVDVFAPGDNVAVILPENDHDYIDGTSVATAIVTGICASVLSVDPEMSPKEVARIIRNSSCQLGTLKEKCKSGGFVKMDKALGLVENGYEREK